MFSLMCFFLMVIGICDLVLALAPPSGMGSKEFYRELDRTDYNRDSRSEARQDPGTVWMEAEIYNDWLWKLKLSDLTVDDLPVILGMHRNAVGHIYEIEMVDPALIDEETARSLYRVKMRLIMRADQLKARYLELADLNRSEARMKSQA